jgi:hypothetical protein
VLAVVAGAITLVSANGVCKGLNNANVYNRFVCWCVYEYRIISYSD